MTFRTKLSIVLGLAVLFIGGAYTLIVHAAVADNVVGRAWSSNIGWIELNNCTKAGDSSSCNNGSNYGVTIDQTTGALSGYAWSSSIGWVSFNSASVASCNPQFGSSCDPRVDFSAANSDGSRNIIGWARACSVFVSGCSGPLRDNYERGGWDGFIALGDTNRSDTVTWGVRLNTDGTIVGDAWDGGAPQGGVSGWINFKGKTIPPPPPVLIVDLKANGQDNLSVASGTPVTLTWTVSGAATATACNASGGWSGSKSVTGGTEDRGAVTATVTYILTCTDGATLVADSATVTITTPGALSVTLKADPNPVTSGSTTKLTWAVTGTATSCTASGGWSGSKSVTGGMETSSPITKTTTFAISCIGPKGNGGAQVVVTILGGDGGGGGGGGGTECSDNLDNDGDGKIDLLDPGCTSATDNSELDPKQIYIEF